MCLFQLIIIFNPLQQRNETGSQPGAHTHRDDETFAVENACNALSQNEQTLPSVVHHIPSGSELQDKVTPYCDNFVLTYRERAHFLCPRCDTNPTTQKTWAQNMTSTRINT
jgi:hypothetical protein